MIRLIISFVYLFLQKKNNFQEPEYFQTFRYLAIEQAQFFVQKEESGADSREMEEEEERLNMLGGQAESNAAGGFAGAVTEFWLTLPEQIQNVN